MPIDPEQLLIFLPAALALNLTPGNDMVFSLNQGLIHGPRAGIAASLGIATGSFAHSVIAAIGLAALVSANTTVFQTIRWIGIAYLVYLALKTLVFQTTTSTFDNNNGHSNRGADSSFRTLRAVWLQGTLVNLTNPKVIVFMLAFVPQFVDPERGSTAVQFLMYGLLMNIGGTVINGAVGYYAGQFSNTLNNNPAYIKTLGYLSAFIFLALALRLALF